MNLIVLNEKKKRLPEFFATNDIKANSFAATMICTFPVGLCVTIAKRV